MQIFSNTFVGRIIGPKKPVFRDVESKAWKEEATCSGSHGWGSLPGLSNSVCRFSKTGYTWGPRCIDGGLNRPEFRDQQGQDKNRMKRMQPWE